MGLAVVDVTHTLLASKRNHDPEGEVDRLTRTGYLGEGPYHRYKGGS